MLARRRNPHPAGPRNARRQPSYRSAAALTSSFDDVSPARPWSTVSTTESPDENGQRPRFQANQLPGDCTSAPLNDLEHRMILGVGQLREARTYKAPGDLAVSGVVFTIRLHHRSVCPEPTGETQPQAGATPFDE